MSKLNSYELVLILRPDATDEQRNAVLERAKDIITSDQGVMLRIDEWGKKRFAYEIKHLLEGFYYVLYFDADPKTLDEVTRVLRITDTVVRFMAVRRSESLAVQELPSVAEPVAEEA